MSKFNSRFSHLRINVGTDEQRNTAEKPKTNYFRDSNTLRIQSPKNLNTLTNRPVPVIYSSPMTAKNESKNYLVNNFTKEIQPNNPSSLAKNSSSGYLNTMQNKHDRMEMSAKAGKPNLLNIIKSNLLTATVWLSYRFFENPVRKFYLFLIFMLSKKLL